MESRLSALLCLSILQPTIRSPDYPVCSVWRSTTTDYLLCFILSGDTMYNQLSALSTFRSPLSGDILHPNIPCALLYLATLHSTIRCTIHVEITNEYPLCSLWRCTTTEFLLRFTLSADTMYNRLSALLYLAILLPTIRSTDYPLDSVRRY
jgi:hypothetical protein